MYGYGISRRAIAFTSSFSFLSSCSFVYSGFGFDWLPLADAHENGLAVGGDGDRGRVPPGRDEPGDDALLRLLDVHHRDAVVVRVRHVQPLPVRADRDRVRRRPLRRLREQRGVDHLVDDALLGVDHVDAVARRARDEQPPVGGVQGELVRVLADRDLRHDAQLDRIERQHLPPRPVRDVQEGAVRPENHVVGAPAERADAGFSSAPFSFIAVIVPPLMSSV
jgi:hypothetical protein